MVHNRNFYNAETKIWRGIDVPCPFSEDYTLGRAALEAMLKNPQKIGQICYHNGRKYTNKELAALTISVAHHFTKLGAEQCDVIGICASNSDYVAPLFFGAMLKGLIASTLDVSYDKDGIKHTFGITKPKFMFCDGDIYERVKAALQELDMNIKIFTMKDHIEGVPSIEDFLKNSNASLDFAYEPLKMGQSQTAVILSSSGTTGLRKGVTMSHEDQLNIGYNELVTEERALCFSTLHWLTGLMTLTQGTISGMTRVISDKEFSTADLFDMVEKYRVTLLFTPPSHMALSLASPQLATADLSSVEKYFCGGSAVSYSVVAQLKKFMPNARFYNGYGMSEARCGIASGEVLENTTRVGIVGKNMQIKILNDNGEKLGPNEVGEFYFKTPFKWNGYYGNEQATAAVYDADQWIATGDLGYIDERGQLYLVDRKKDILKYYGYHYSPTEIEHVIHEISDVVEVCVFGMPDVVATDLPAAAVIKKIGSKLSEEEICEHVERRMAHYNQLRGGVFFFDKLPLTATGKVLRREVKKICIKLKDEKNQSKLVALPVEITSL